MFIYNPLETSLEKQTKTVVNQEKEQIKALEKHGEQPIKSSGERDFLELLE